MKKDTCNPSDQLEAVMVSVNCQLDKSLESLGDGQLGMFVDIGRPNVTTYGTVPKAGILDRIKVRSELRNRMHSLLSAVMYPAAPGSCCNDFITIDCILEV